MNAIHWAVLALIAFAAALLVGSSIALGVAVALVVALGFALFTSKPVQTSLTASRITDGSLVEVGSTVGAKVRVEAGGAFALRWLLVHDTIPPGALVDAPTGRLSIGSSGLTAEFFYNAKFEKRGVYRLGPVEASHGDILNLRTAKESLDRSDEVVVYPHVQLMQSFQVSSSRPLGDRRADQRHHEDPTRPAGCRPYVQGDPLKRVHWAASARAGTLVSKVYDASSAPIYVVVLNMCHTDYTTPDRFEVACTAAASILSAFSRDGHEIGFLATEYIKPDSGRLHMERCLSEVARAGFSPQPFYETLLRARTELPWRASLVIVTEQIDEHSAATLEIMRAAGYSVAAMVIGDPIETQMAIGRIAALGGSVARIEQEVDLVTARFVGAGR